jgi:glycosyltransferase involved in cell wall biosynthesis
MHIAFISNMAGAPWGGSEELWFQTALELRRRGVKVSACVQDWSQRARQIGEMEASDVQLAFRPQPTRAARLRRRVFGDLATHWLAELDADLLIINQGHNTGGAGWAQQWHSRNRPYAVLSHAAGESYWPPAYILPAERENLQRAKAVYFVSRHNRDLTARQLGLPLDRAEVVWNPFQSASAQALPWPAEDGVVRLACVGRLEPRDKGQDLIGTVLASPKWRERKLSITLYGNGPYREYLQEMIRDLPSVTLGGFADVATIWRTHHALLLPSRIEGLPITIIEAMHAGRPCIATDVGGAAEVIRDGVDGFIVPFPSVSALDTSLERAWLERSRWREMGQAAAVHVRQLVPPNAPALFADKLLQLL